MVQWSYEMSMRESKRQALERAKAPDAQERLHRLREAQQEEHMKSKLHSHTRTRPHSTDQYYSNPTRYDVVPCLHSSSPPSPPRAVRAWHHTRAHTWSRARILLQYSDSNSHAPAHSACCPTPTRTVLHPLHTHTHTHTHASLLTEVHEKPRPKAKPHFKAKATSSAGTPHMIGGGSGMQGGGGGAGYRGSQRHAGRGGGG